MQGEIVKMWVIIDGETGEILNEYDDYQLAKAALKYRYDPERDTIKKGFIYCCGDYGSPIYWSVKNLRECESVK
jgi:hypothetical protein